MQYPVWAAMQLHILSRAVQNRPSAVESGLPIDSWPQSAARAESGRRRTVLIVSFIVGCPGWLLVGSFFSAVGMANVRMLATTKYGGFQWRLYKFPSTDNHYSGKRRWVPTREYRSSFLRVQETLFRGFEQKWLLSLLIGGHRENARSQTKPHNGSRRNQ